MCSARWSRCRSLTSCPSPAWRAASLRLSRPGGPRSHPPGAQCRWPVPTRQGHGRPRPGQAQRTGTRAVRATGQGVGRGRPGTAHQGTGQGVPRVRPAAAAVTLEEDLIRPPDGRKEQPVMDDTLRLPETGCARRRPDPYPFRADNGIRRAHGGPVRRRRLSGAQPGRRRRHHLVHRRLRRPDRHALRGAQVPGADRRAAGRLRPADRPGPGSRADVLREHESRASCGRQAALPRCSSPGSGPLDISPAATCPRSPGSPSGHCWPSSCSASCSSSFISRAAR